MVLMMSRLQSALEYLTTYGWALLILAIVIGFVFYSLRPSTPSECVIGAGFECTNYYMSQNGVAVVTIKNTANPLYIKDVGCFAPQTDTVLSAINNPPSNEIYLPTGSSSTLNIQCYSNDTAFSGTIGNYYSGFIAINYTDASTLFPQFVSGKMVIEISN